MFACPVLSKPVKRWNFRKAKWSQYITLTNKLARTLPPHSSPDIDYAYQYFCIAISTAAKSVSYLVDEIIIYHLGIPTMKTSAKHSCNTLKGITLSKLLQPGLPRLTGNGEIDGLRLTRTLSFLAG